MNIRWVDLAAGQSKLVGEAGQSIRSIMNTGTAIVTLSAANPAVVGDGYPLSAAAAAGDMGGSYDWSPPLLLEGPLYAVAPAATRLAIMEG